jgi:serine phosphatase RsbU (regulator of sigma subunit)
MKNLKLKKGDKILLFTDGIIEARNNLMNYMDIKD